jgi:hypothetical protein
MALSKHLGTENPGSKVAYQGISAQDMQDPTLAKLNALLLQISQGVNYALGYSGTVVLVGGMQVNGDLDMQGHAIKVASQLGTSPVPIIIGSRGGNAALTSLITQLAKLGVIIDKTT